MHIIGGGIIGLCCAWYLKKAGYDVTIVDRTDLQDGCSFGNAGIIVPSHSVPLAAPGAISQGIRWMFNSRSPFYIRPRFDADLIGWLWRFNQACNPAHVKRSTPLLKDFHLLSKSLYQEFNSLAEFQFDFEERGSLMLYNSAKGRRTELEHAEYAASLGLHVSVLSRNEVEALHPGMSCDVLGGVHYHDDAHLYPGKFVLQLQHALKAQGVHFLTGKNVTGFATSGARITHIRFDHAPSIPVQEVVLASGAWTGHLAKQLGLRLLIQDGKGYSVTLQNFSPRPSIPAVLSEARVAVTPMGNDLRVGGTLEVSHFNSNINTKRVEAILRAMTRYYPDFPVLKPNNVDIWYGFRPVTPDGLPYIGRPKVYDNLIIAAGHAMLGMSLGPATGMLVSEIAQRQQSSLPPAQFHPDRF